MTMTMDIEQDGNEAIDEIGKKPNIDMFFDRNPKHLSDEELMRYIEIERMDRARQIAKKGK